MILVKSKPVDEALDTGANRGFQQRKGSSQIGVKKSLLGMLRKMASTQRGDVNDGIDPFHDGIDRVLIRDVHETLRPGSWHDIDANDLVLAGELACEFRS